MVKPVDACVKPARGPILGEDAEVSPAQSEVMREDKLMTLARVGHPAPDFEASAYVEGGFRNIKLSDYKGQWVVLCFYPGDFTFV